MGFSSPLQFHGAAAHVLSRFVARRQHIGLELVGVFAEEAECRKCDWISRVNKYIAVGLSIMQTAVSTHRFLTVILRHQGPKLRL